MKKKVITKTYLREAEKYKIKIWMDEEDYYVSLKKLIHVTQPFIIHKNITAMDDGYFILEIIPKKGHQALRLFLNDKKEVVEYYFDIIKESGLTEDKIPYYLDLYLDVTIQRNGEVNILDEEELEKAYQENEISEEDYHLAKKEKEKLLKELKENRNELLRINYKKYLEEE